ncbi:unnamed protein product [Hymenolepis diminuta]|uniref:Uncharacterized protein n=1 Tax=Hymenolepis diminuta TaxID=6216 RepID=A0A564YWG6_HYMDI|nr:unnamed protein product [Hymenolepis diminuta]
MSCPNAPIDFPLFSITVSFHLKSTSAFMHSVLPNKNNVGRRVPTHPAHLLSSSAHCPFSLSPCYLFQTRCDILECTFGLINSWCSASQFLLALPQTATNWQLLLLSLFIICKPLVVM